MDKYDLDLGNGIVVGEIDKPLVDDFLKVAHSAHLTNDQNKAVLKAYFAVQEKVTEARNQEDLRLSEECEEALRPEWGKEFRANLNRVTQMLDRVGGAEQIKTAQGKDESLTAMILHGRLADGTPIGSSPAALKLLLGVALLENPAGALVPAGSGPAGIENSIAEIEKFMKTNRAAYNKDEKLQARYRDLLEAQEKRRQASWSDLTSSTKSLVSTPKQASVARSTTSFRFRAILCVAFMSHRSPVLPGFLAGYAACGILHTVVASYAWWTPRSAAPPEAHSSQRGASAAARQRPNGTPWQALQRTPPDDGSVTDRSWTQTAPEGMSKSQIRLFKFNTVRSLKKLDGLRCRLSKPA